MVEFRNGVQHSFGLELPATVMFDYPTPRALAEYIAGLLLPSAFLVTSSNPVSTRRGLADGDQFTKIVGWEGAMASAGHSLERSESTHATFQAC